MSDEEEIKKLEIISTRGTLDWGYPPFILASTAAALDMEVHIFYSFYGLELLRPKIKSSITVGDNAAMPISMPFGPKWFKKINWPIPKIITSNVPGFDAMATSMFKMGLKNNGVASLEELREMCLEADVEMIACQMTMDLFNIEKEDLIPGIETAGATAFLDFAADADVTLFM